MLDQLIICHVLPLHVLQYHIELSEIEIVCITVTKSIEIVPVELGVPLRQNSEIQGRKREYLISIDAVQDIDRLYEGVSFILLSLEGSEFEVDRIRDDILCAEHRILNHYPIVEHDFSLDFRFPVILV